MIILASDSPRRKELLSDLFGDINIYSQHIDESYSKSRPSFVVREIAVKKLKDIEADYNDIVISADTIVYFKGKFLGKPKSKREALETLKSLSGKTHSVYTGVAVRFRGKTVSFYDKTYVTFKRLDDDDVKNYIDGGSPMDKAGSYGIQDKWMIKNFKGSYNNVLGLPTEKLVSLLADLGADKYVKN